VYSSVKAVVEAVNVLPGKAGVGLFVSVGGALVTEGAWRSLAGGGLITAG